MAKKIIGNDKSRRQYMAWLKAEHPKLYALVKAKNPGLAGLGASWMDSVMDVVKGAVPMIQQQKIFKAQLDRAKVGLPPLKTEELTPPGVPIQVKLSPEIEKQVTGGLATGRNMMMLGVAGGLALLLFGMIKKRKA